MAQTSTGIKPLILRYYHELWNEWNFSVADEILAPTFTFRGSFGVELKGILAFKEYVAMVRAASSDFTNVIEQFVDAGRHGVARLKYEGTHSGNLLGIPATGKRFTYPGIALFEQDEGRLFRGNVVGDRASLLECILGRNFWTARAFRGTASE